MIIRYAAINIPSAHTTHLICVRTFACEARYRNTSEIMPAIRPSGNITPVTPIVAAMINSYGASAGTNSGLTCNEKTLI